MYLNVAVIALLLLLYYEPLSKIAWVLKESTKKASRNQYEEYSTNLDLGQLLICAAAGFLLLCYVCLLLCIAHTPLYMRHSFYLLKLFPCETWLQGWIHFWRCSHKSQLAYGGWHRERRKRIKNGDSRDTKESEWFFSRPQAESLTTIVSKA